MKLIVNHSVSNGINAWAKFCNVLAFISLIGGIITTFISLFEEAYGATGIGGGLLLLSFSLAISRRLLQGFSAIVRNTEFELATGGDDKFIIEGEQPEKE